MNKSTYELLDDIDTKIDMLGMVQRNLARQTFAIYEKIGDECVDVNMLREYAEETWALSEQLCEQVQNIRLMLRPVLKV